MKRIISFLAALLIGVGLGWYFGYTRPTATNQRELLRQYQNVRDNFHMTDAEMADAGPKIPQFFADMKRRDEMAAIFGLGGFKILEQGDTERAKTFLLKAVGNYYHIYRDKGGDTNLMWKIEQAAQKYPAVAAEISRENQ